MFGFPALMLPLRACRKHLTTAAKLFGGLEGEVHVLNLWACGVPLEINLYTNSNDALAEALKTDQ
jgi:hypothetical protein